MTKKMYMNMPAEQILAYTTTGVEGRTGPLWTLPVIVTVKTPRWEKHFNMNGRLHREDGPAVVGPVLGFEEDTPRDAFGEYDANQIFWGKKTWEPNDTDAGFYRHVCYAGSSVGYCEDPEMEKIMYRQYWIDGKLHRTDGPAVIHNGPNGLMEWWQNGRLHREDGPAVVQHRDDYASGVDLYFVEGVQMSFKEFYGIPDDIWKLDVED